MERGIKEFIKLFEGEKNFIMQEATKRVSNSLVRLSPVDEGEFVADWDAAIDHWPINVENPDDPKKHITRRRLQDSFKGVKYGQAVFFQNDDPAASRLEFGYSKQAPQGVVRLTVRKFRRIVRGVGKGALTRVKKKMDFD